MGRLLYGKGDEAPEQDAQRGYRVSFCGYMQDPSQRLPEQPATNKEQPVSNKEQCLVTMNNLNKNFSSINV